MKLEIYQVGKVPTILINQRMSAKRKISHGCRQTTKIQKGSKNNEQSSM